MNGVIDGLTMAEGRRKLAGRLAAVMDGREADAVASMAMEHVTRLSPVELALHAREPLSDYQSGQLDKMLYRLLDNEPIQYILGEAEWSGLKLRVTPDVLIPRPETAQLVDIITDRWGGRSDLQVLDVCTGSGCIAVALALRLKFADVTAIDISEEALAVARENAARYRVNVDFELRDALGLRLDRRYDIIVSNPPYIAEEERRGMEPGVLEHEPGLALFVPDDDPLRFYRSIMQGAADGLKSGGMLYFEINPRFVEQLKRLAGQVLPGRDVEVARDLYGRERFMVIS